MAVQEAAAPARPRAARRAALPPRNPELDLARAVALAVAAVVVLAPTTEALPALLRPSAFEGATLADLLPATFATIAGVAIASQWRRRGHRSWVWWLLRLVRRLAVLVLAGLFVAWATDLPTLPVDWSRLRWTGDLVRLGVASVLVVPLVRLPRWGEVAVATALLVLHTAVTLAGGLELTPVGNGLAGWDQLLLGPGHALGPVDPDGVTALAPTLVAMLVGFWIGEWLEDRDRGATTAAVLLLLAGWSAVVGWSWHQVVPANATLWTLPVVAGGVAVTLALLAVGHLGTRRDRSDVAVATLGTLGQVTLPAWLLLVLGGHLLAGLAGWETLVVELLGQLLTPAGATVAVGLAAVALLTSAAGNVVDRGWSLRA